MKSLATDGCVGLDSIPSFLGCTSDELAAAVATIRNTLPSIKSRMKVDDLRAIGYWRSSGGRLFYNLDPATMIFARSSPVSLIVRSVLTDALIIAIASYLECVPRELFVDSTAVVLQRSTAGHQGIHQDHQLGPHLSVMVAISLSSKSLTTRFLRGTHLFTEPEKVAAIAMNDVVDTCTRINSRIVLFDTTTLHEGAASPPSSDRWIGYDRLLITISRPIPDRNEYQEHMGTKQSYSLHAMMLLD